MQSSTSRTFLTKSKGYNREDFIQGQTQFKSDIKHTLLIIGQNPRFIKNKELPSNCLDIVRMGHI